MKGSNWKRQLCALVLCALILPGIRAAGLAPTGEALSRWKMLVFGLVMLGVFDWWLAGRRVFSAAVVIPSGLFALISTAYRCLGAEYTLTRPNPIWFIYCLGCFWVFYFCALGVLYERFDQITPKRSVQRHIPYFWVLLVLWLPYVLLCFPGGIPYDTGTSLLYSLGIDRSNTNNPYFQNYLFGAVYRLGEALGSVSGGIFLYVLLQMLFYLVCLSRSLNLLEHWGTHPRLVLGLLLLYGVLPVFPCYALSMGKDSNFALVLLSLGVLLLEFSLDTESFLKSRGKMAALALLSVLAGLLRNGGYLIGLLCVLACGVLRLRRTRQLSWRFVPILLGILAVEFLLPPILRVPEGTINEFMSIPLQQTAYYAVEFPDEVTDRERKVISAVIDYDVLGEYVPGLADPVKDRFKADASREELADYWGVWMAQFRKHPDAYLKAFYHQSYAYYSPAAERSDLKYHVFVGNMASTEAQEKTMLKFNTSMRHVTVRNVDAFFLSLPVVGLLQRIGIYTWMLLVIVAYLIKRRQPGKLICLIPAICTLVACCFSPVNGYFRYAFGMIFSVPVLFVGVLYAPEGKK